MGVAFLGLTDERSAVFATNRAMVGEAQPLPEKPVTRGRIQ
jgi:hypothetical protein